ncbi:hypothetical protein Scani_68320 [Streptomyces caniferus]|uniref:Uncharacterized protein n=2 Tax=Streptomyces caniferus TaxID=285557 RepID=A0A640SIA6_9ACTN|nr:hypothetical protein Scani_68320 [Streptomyces caniferus]
MDPLVVAAGTALVSSMATDAWQHARDATVALWRRVHPERVSAIEAELADVRAEVIAARDEGDSQVEEELAADWQRRLRRLLRDDPSLAGELRRVLDEELNPLLAPADQPRIGVQMTATASGHARVYQAGGSQTIREA